MPFRIGVGAKHPEEPIRKDRPGRPDLLTIEDEIIAVDAGGGTDRRHVTAGTGFGPTLCPDLLPRGHGWKEALLLLLGSVLHESGAEEKDAILVEAQRRLDPPVLLLEDQPFEEVHPPAAILLRPGDHGPARVVEFALPGAMRPGSLGGVEGRQRLGGNVGFEPGPRLCSKCLLARRVGEVHQSRPSNFASRFSTKASRASWESGEV